MNPHPHPWFNRLSAATMILGGISLISIIANLTVFALLFPKIVAFEPLPDWTEPVMNGIVGIGFLIIAMTHMVALTALGWEIKVVRRTTAVSALLAALGTISLLLVAANFPLLGDIGKQYKAGLGTGGERTFVFINHGIHAVFLVLAALRIGYANRVLAAGTALEPAVRDEAVFLGAHVIGILSGLAGLGVMASLVLFGFPVRILSRAVAVLGVVVIAPYAAAVVSWLVLKLGQPPREWMDERQLTDLGRAALASLFITYPLLAAGYIVQRQVLPEGVAGCLWFPVAAFLTLFVFSACAARLNRQPSAPDFSHRPRPSKER
jgi:hypothetical protein